jgi:acyl carrier protein
MIMDQPSESLDTAQDEASRERTLIAVVSELVRELNPQARRPVDVARSSQLDRDLGIDSLGRTELILRLERAFRVRLPIQVLSQANTVGDILAALKQMPKPSGTTSPLS